MYNKSARLGNFPWIEHGLSWQLKREARMNAMELERPGSVSPGSVSPGSVSPGSVSPGSVSPGSESPGSVSPGSVSQGFDVIVVGGGQAGLSVGYHLARRGLSFVIL